MPLYAKSLWALLKESRSYPMTIMDTLQRLQMLESIIKTLGDLQDRNLCHLDIKPSNILINLTENGQWNGDLVLTDFGLSGTVDSATGRAGTPGFGSPEQFVDHVHKHSDNYGLGKLAVLLIFAWNHAWELLAQPKDLQEAIKDSEGYEFISQLLHVS